MIVVAPETRSPHTRRAAGWVLALSVGVALGVAAQQKKLGYSDTPLLPGGKWHVHDGDRPQPRMVEPGTASSQDAPGRPPSDAVVLFGGKDLSAWKASNGGGPAGWKVENGEMVIAPRAGQIETREEFGDCQLHVEFTAPTEIKGEGQGRGNSGVFLFGRYEIQVLDSFNNPTYPDGQASAIYGQFPPLVNASRRPGQWQTYDILFRGPRFAPDGALQEPALATVLHNGVAVHHATRVLGPMSHKQLPVYKAHPAKGPIALQDHGNPVRYRNLWIRELRDPD